MAHGAVAEYGDGVLADVRAGGRCAPAGADRLGPHRFVGLELVGLPGGSGANVHGQDGPATHGQDARASSSPGEDVKDSSPLGSGRTDRFEATEHPVGPGAQVETGKALMLNVPAAKGCVKDRGWPRPRF